MRKRLSLALLALLSLLASAALGFYIFLPKISQPLLEKKLTELGCEQLRLRIEEIGIHAARAAEVHCFLPGTGELTLRGVEFAYSLRGLLSGRIGSLSVQYARATILHAQAAAGSEEGIPLPKSFFYSAPIAELSVEKLELSYPDKKTTIDLGLNLAFGLSSIEGRLRGNGMAAGTRIEFDTTFSLQKNEMSMRAQKLSAAQSAWRVSLPPGAELTLQRSGDSMRASLSQDLLVSLLYENKWRELRLHDLVGTVGHRTGASFRVFYHEDLPILPVEVALNQKNSQLEVRGQPVDFLLAKSLPVLEEITGAKDLPLQVMEGQLKLGWSAKLALGGDASLLQAEASGELSGVGGTYAEMPFAGVRYPLRVRWAKNSLSVESALFQMDSVDFGLVAKGIRARVGLQKSKGGPGVDLLINQARAEVFSGEILVESLSLNSAKLESTFQAELKGVGLKEIVELQKQESITASGLLDGTLPIHLSKRGIVIEGGIVRARAPGGKIAYQASQELAAVASGNPSLKLAVDVLRDFDYQILEGTVDYAESGELKIALRVEGRNPGWSEGRPVHFNFTISDNLPKLLRSLRIAQEMGDALEKKMQEGNQ